MKRWHTSRINNLCGALQGRVAGEPKRRRGRRTPKRLRRRVAFGDGSPLRLLVPGIAGCGRIKGMGCRQLWVERGGSVRTIWTIVVLFVCLLGVSVLFLTSVGLRGIYPLPAAMAFALLVFGAWLEGKWFRWTPLFFIYGCMGGLLFTPLIIPNRRSLRLSRSEALWQDWSVTITCIVVVFIAGAICRLVAGFRYEREQQRQRYSGRCLECGYPLYGLPERRCPECGTPFDLSQVLPTSPPCETGDRSRPKRGAQVDPDDFEGREA